MIAMSMKRTLSRKLKQHCKSTILQFKKKKIELECLVGANAYRKTCKKSNSTKVKSIDKYGDIIVEKYDCR